MHPRSPSCLAAPADAAPPAEPQPVTFCFSVQAVADVGLLARILGQFAKRGLTPSRCYSDADAATGRLHVDLQVAGLEPEQGSLIAQALRATVGVELVLTSRKFSTP